MIFEAGEGESALLRQSRVEVEALPSENLLAKFEA